MEFLFIYLFFYLISSDRDEQGLVWQFNNIMKTQTFSSQPSSACQHDYPVFIPGIMITFTGRRKSVAYFLLLTGRKTCFSDTTAEFPLCGTRWN